MLHQDNKKESRQSWRGDPIGGGGGRRHTVERVSGHGQYASHFLGMLVTPHSHVYVDVVDVVNSGCCSYVAAIDEVVDGRTRSTLCQIAKIDLLSAAMKKSH